MQRLSPTSLLRALSAVLLTLIAGLRKKTYPSADLLEVTRYCWSQDARLRIEANATIRIDRDGTWISAWVLAGDIDPLDPDALRVAKASLPLLPREVYRLLTEERLTYRQIADRLGISVGEVRQYVADALWRLAAAARPE